MTLRSKLYSTTFILHGFLFAIVWSYQDELKAKLIIAEILLVVSLAIFTWLIKKMLQPLEYIETLSSILNEQEFTTRFNKVNQSDIDQLIKQFNRMLQILHSKRLEVGEQQGILHKLMHESPIGVVILDYDKRITDINPAAQTLLSLTLSEASNKTLQQFPDSKISVLNEVSIDSEQLMVVDDGQRLKIGHYHIHDRGFDRSFYILQELTSDITRSQKAAYEKLIRVMCHEVNNTIAASNSLLESCLTFKDELCPGSKNDFEQAINIVTSRCDSLNQFMQDYANIVKIPRPLRAYCDISRQLKNLATLFHAECSSHEIHLALDIEDGILIFADAHLMQQALVNIIKNAIESIENKGRIGISLQQKSEFVELVVNDSGCGLDDETQQQIFSPFFTTKDSGQGIGLMLVNEILNLHCFKYRLSNNIGTPGAYFQITMPQITSP